VPATPTHGGSLGELLGGNLLQRRRLDIGRSLDSVCVSSRPEAEFGAPHRAGFDVSIHAISHNKGLLVITFGKQLGVIAADRALHVARKAERFHPAGDLVSLLREIESDLFLLAVGQRLSGCGPCARKWWRGFAGRQRNR